VVKKDKNLWTSSKLRMDCSLKKKHTLSFSDTIFEFLGIFMVFVVVAKLQVNRLQIFLAQPTIKEEVLRIL